jgi:hypothetical protein
MTGALPDQERNRIKLRFAGARDLFLVRPRRGDIPVALLCVFTRTMKREG